MNALDVSPYLRLTPRSEREAREDTAQLEALGALQDLFGTSGDVVLTVERMRGQPVVDAFTNKEGRSAIQQAYEHSESATDPTYPSNGYRGCIVLHDDNTWTVERLFKGDAE